MRTCAQRSGSRAPLTLITILFSPAGLAGGLLVAAACADSDEVVEQVSDITGHTSPGAREDAPRLPIYLDRSYSAEERAADLVSSLSLTEKASQLISSQSPAIPRLGVREYGWWNEAAHGAAREGTLTHANPPILINTTSYPVDLSIGATWNPELIHREAQLISDEVREVFRDNRLDLNVYSPTINLARDPRWGRNDEAFSEDPLLTAVLAAGFVNGMEGKDRDGRFLPESRGYLKVSTTLKHYAANNSEFNRRNGSSDMDDRTLREYYTLQFREAIRRSDPSSIMTSYNRVNGVPTTASVYLQENLARQTFGFRGFFTSDCDSIREIEDGHHWQPPGYPHPLDAFERHAWANASGNDLDCQQGYHDEWNYANTILAAIARGIATETGIYSEGDVDAAAVRLFTTRMRLGEWDDPEDVPWVTAARARVPPGTWENADSNGAVTQTPERLAMARAVGGESIVLLKNGGASGRILPLSVPATGPYRIAVMGYYASTYPLYLGGYSSIQQSAGVANHVSGYDGIRAAVLARNPDAVVDAWPGVTSAALDQVDPASVEAAAGYDAVIVYVGDDSRHSREDIDRGSLALPGAQASLIQQVAARNRNTIVYMETVGQVDVAGFEADVAALLWSSHNGQRKGESLADVLLGAVNPSGRLPFTWYADLSQLPPIGDYSIRPSASSRGRTYMYFTGDITYPFGFGLSYARFRYSDLRLDHRRVDANDTLHVSAKVTNVSPIAGSEVVQLYVATPGAPAALERPVKRLRGFQKIALRGNQTAEVHFTLPVADLAFFDEARGRAVVDPGDYVIAVARSSADRDIERQATVHVSGFLRAVPAVATARPIAWGDADRGIARRVFFPIGALVDPQLTVAMSDDTLVGFIARGASRPFPRELTVTYESNRPRVVSVGPHGLLRAAGRGVATVTARVEYRGVRVSTRFVVYVQ